MKDFNIGMNKCDQTEHQTGLYLCAFKWYWKQN